MGSRYLTDLATVVRGAGLPCTEYSGWQTRARGSGGYESGRPTHIMVHHTASSSSQNGKPDADYIAVGSGDAPLSNLYIDRQGKVWVIAAGATNTNGKGHDYWGGGVPDDSMNSYAIGIEAGNNGVGEAWPTVQQDAYVKLVKALMTNYGIPLGHVRAHFEWAPDRKIDPAGSSRYANGGASWNMDKFRTDCYNAAGGSVPEPTPEPEDDVALSDDDINRIVAAVWAKKYSIKDQPQPQAAGWILANTYGLGVRAVRASEEAAANTRSTP
jgi:N-acetylmuramoyl-L-alanine amidase